MHFCQILMLLNHSVKPTVKVEYLSLVILVPILQEEEVIKGLVFCPCIVGEALVKPVFTRQVVLSLVGHGRIYRG